MRRELSRARPKTGNRMAAKSAIIAITTNSSISVNAKLKFRFRSLYLYMIRVPINGIARVGLG